MGNCIPEPKQEEQLTYIKLQDLQELAERNPQLLDLTFFPTCCNYSTTKGKNKRILYEWKEFSPTKLKFKKHIKLSNTTNNNFLGFCEREVQCIYHSIINISDKCKFNLFMNNYS